MYIDAHNHLLRAVPADGARFFAARAEWQLVNSVDAGDWETLAGLAGARAGEVFPFFGIHPWAKDAPGGWESALEKILTECLRNPAIPGVGIGETGLDRRKSTLPLPAQAARLRPQLELARCFRIPVTLHCLGAAQELYAALYPEFSGLSVLLHAFGGGIPEAKRFIDQGAFFSFSAAGFAPGRQRARELLAYVPDDRLLLETDATDAPPDIRETYRQAAALRRTPPEALAAQLRRNAEDFLGVRPPTVTR